MKPTTMRSLLLVAAAWALASCSPRLTLVATTRLAENQRLFQPTQLPPDHRFSLPAGASEQYIPVSGGSKLNAIHIKNASSKYLIICFQKKGTNLESFLQENSALLKLGPGILIADYRGIGKSTGFLDGEDLYYEDAFNVFKYATRLGYAPQNIIVFGQEIGAPAATYLAARHRVAGLILESPFSALNDLSWAANKFTSYKFNIAKQARRVTEPALVIQGDDDDLFPAAQSNQVYMALRSKQKSLETIKSARKDMGRTRMYEQCLRKFVREIAEIVQPE